MLISIIGATLIVICLVIYWYLTKGYTIFIKKPKYDKISFKESLDLTNVPIITFENNGRKLNFLLDTGSNRSLINARELETCDYRDDNSYNKLVGIDGIERTVFNVHLPLKYKTSEYKELFQVTDISNLCDDAKRETGVNLHGILGNTFFIKYKYIIDFEELVAYSKGLL